MNDIKYTDDIQAENGDFKIIDSKNQHIEHNLRANPGDYLQFPDIGAGINKNILNSALDFLGLKKIIKRTLEIDDMRLIDFMINNKKIFIAAE